MSRRLSSDSSNPNTTAPRGVIDMHCNSRCARAPAFTWSKSNTKRGVGQTQDKERMLRELGPLNIPTACNTNIGPGSYHPNESHPSYFGTNTRILRAAAYTFSKQDTYRDMGAKNCSSLSFKTGTSDNSRLGPGCYGYSSQFGTR